MNLEITAPIFITVVFDKMIGCLQFMNIIRKTSWYVKR